MQIQHCGGVVYGQVSLPALSFLHLRIRHQSILQSTPYRMCVIQVKCKAKVAPYLEQFKLFVLTFWLKLAALIDFRDTMSSLWHEKDFYDELLQPPSPSLLEHVLMFLQAISPWPESLSFGRYEWPDTMKLWSTLVNGYSLLATTCNHIHMIYYFDLQKRHYCFVAVVSISCRWERSHDQASPFWPPVTLCFHSMCAYKSCLWSSHGFLGYKSTAGIYSTEIPRTSIERTWLQVGGPGELTTVCFNRRIVVRSSV